MIPKLFRASVMLCCMICTLPSFAQETTSDIQGNVSDTKGSVAGATIVAIHLPTGTKYSTTSRKDGRFNLPNLRVGGPYTITTSFIGYKPQKLENIFLVLGQEFKADMALVADATTLEGIVISASRQDKVFNSNRTGSQEIVNRAQIERLPTINRSLQDFTKLEPTSSSTSFGQSFGGRSSQYNNITVDGANFNNSFGLSGTLGGQTNSQPISLDAIEQIQVNVSPYDVRQGGFSGAGVNSATRSGSNQLKGSVYFYTKNENSQGYRVENTLVPKTPITYNIKGITIGGPIVKNKIFFFMNAEQVKQSLPATTFIPSDATHTPGGNISAANADTLNKLASFLQTKYGYDPGAYQGYNFETKSDKVTAKIDWNINAKNTISLKYFYFKSSADQFASTSRPGSGQTGGGVQGLPGANSMPFFGSGYVINNNFNIVIAELNTRMGNKASNKLQAGYTALRDFRSPHSSSATFPLVDILNGGNIYTTFGYEPYTYNNILNTDVYQISDIFTFYRGAHEITVGTQDYYRKYQNAFAPGYQGVYQFNSLQDFFNNASAKNYYLQYSALPDGSFPFAYAGSTEIGVFAQDKWRASPNFTLTYGLRIDESFYKQTFTDNPYFDALIFKDNKQYNIGKAPGNKPLISPRVGFNWSLLKDKSLQVRGGFGSFSGPPPFVWVSNQASNNGIQFGSFTRTAPTTLVTFDADPTKYKPSTAASLASYSIAMVDADFKYPSVFKSSLALDKKFKDGFIITLEGSYSKDVNAVYYSNLNLNETNGYALVGADTRTRYLTTVSTSNKYYSGTTLANPNLGTAILMKNSKKGYSYTATLRLQKTFKNLYLSAAYNYSQAKNTAEGGSTASSLWSARGVYQDPNNDNLANASYYLPHRVIAFASYKFEYAKYFSTTIGAIFEAAPAGVTSYIYNGDLNGDGNTGNDLIYIPASASEINLVKVGSGGLGTGTSTDPRTIPQIYTQLNNFIGQDHYLAFHRGQYARANAVIYPFFKKLDLNITEDISVKCGKDRHTLRLTLDLINAGNFMNRNWGLVKTPNRNNFLTFEGLTADGKPSFSMPYFDAANQVPLVNSFTNNTGITSRWQMQFGIRYLFN